MNNNLSRIRRAGEKAAQIQRLHPRRQIGFGFSAGHWQQIEAGWPITVTTLLRICDTFAVRAAQLIEGLDRGIYRK